jgi:iron-sulfur cluster assembly protein
VSRATCQELAGQAGKPASAPLSGLRATGTGGGAAGRNLRAGNDTTSVAHFIRLREEHQMLVLTPVATDVLRGITHAEGTPDNAGLRIAAAESDQNALEIAVTAGPSEQDQVLTGDGGQIFLDPPAAAYLDDKVLDATVDDDGNAAFLLREQAQNQSNGAGPAEDPQPS